MMDLLEIIKVEHREQAFHVIRQSFAVVAEDFGLTKENAPTNPAFISYEQFCTYFEKDIVLYGLSKDDAIVGCVAIEKSSRNEHCYFIERLAVLPEEQHQGYGKRLLDWAVQAVRDRRGNRVEIGIISEHAVLKKWYLDYGFFITGTKRFEHLPFEVCFLSMDL